MLTDAQMTTLATALRASSDPTVVAALAVRNDVALMDWCNADSTFHVWRTSIPVEDYRDALVWTEVDGLTTGKARIWEWITGNMTLPINASKLAVRQGLADAWASNTSTRPALLAIAHRPATNLEKIFATGTGTEASPGTLVVEGDVGYIEVGTALNRNP